LSGFFFALSDSNATNVTSRLPNLNALLGVLFANGENKNPIQNFFRIAQKAFKFSTAGKVGEKKRRIWFYSHALLARKDRTSLEVICETSAVHFLIELAFAGPFPAAPTTHQMSV
jgi:hypothetical protein